jgi:parvulin-like peptidyl-prolyl isomerase
MRQTEAQKRALNKWKVKNRAKVLAYNVAYNKKYFPSLDKEEVARKKREYMAKSPEQIKKKQVYNNSYRARKLSTSDGTVTTEFIKELFTKQGGRCAISFIPLDNGYHIDHIIPLSKGGEHTRSNIQLVLPSINIQKRAKLDYVYQPNEKICL